VTTNVHDTPLKLCRTKPGFAVELAGEILGLPIPEYGEVVPYSESLTDVEVRDLNADNVVLCRAGKRHQLGIIIEVQREKDKRKLFSWPAYQVNLRHRISAPVVLIVVCPSPAVAAWAAEPIETGQPGSVFRMQVLSPANYPKLFENTKKGKLAEQMVLGTLIHERSDDIERLLETATVELASLEPEKANLYTRYMLGQLSERARTILEALMQQETYPYQSKFVADLKAEGRAEGKAEGIAETLLNIIEVRALFISENQRRRIESCEDPTQLQAWVKRAITAPSVSDIFA
jgi:hypothetical protein